MIIFGVPDAPIINVDIRDPSALGPDDVLAIGKTDPREMISLYDVWLEDKIRSGDDAVLDALDHIATIVSTGRVLLYCSNDCESQPCHGLVIQRYIENALKGKDPWAH